MGSHGCCYCCVYNTQLDPWLLVDILPEFRQFESFLLYVCRPTPAAMVRGCHFKRQPPIVRVALFSFFASDVIKKTVAAFFSCKCFVAALLFNIYSLLFRHLLWTPWRKKEKKRESSCHALQDKSTTGNCHATPIISLLFSPFLPPPPPCI